MQGAFEPKRRATGLGPGDGVQRSLNAYNMGDVNFPEQLDEWKSGDDGWRKLDPPNHRWKYLTYVKQLSMNWPHLELLADFMMVGTTPVRWIPNALGSYPEDAKAKHEARRRRMARTNVTILEYSDDVSPPSRKDFTESSALREHIAALDQDRAADADVQFRLFVVEDLSSDVIEILGARYDVNPLFFREHLFDNIWYNIRDWWRDPPNLDIVAKNQNWFQMRFQRARYFKSKESMAIGEAQSLDFNVHRQLQGDHNTSLKWDTYYENSNTKREPRIGHIRSRATFWMKRPDENSPSPHDQANGSAQQQHQQQHQHQQQGDSPKGPEPLVGILLLDPTIEEGHPLWRQYRNWNRVPSMSERPPPEDARPPRAYESSLFEDFIYWASRPDAFDQGPYHEHGSGPAAACLPTQALLHVICNEWLTLVDYIKTRLNQIDWEIAFPDSFLTKDEQIETALHKLHLWRRVVPIYRAMLAETFLRVFREAKHPDRMHPGRREGMSFHANADLLRVLHEGDAPARASVDLSVQERRRSNLVAGGGPGPAHRAPPAAGALHDLLDRDCIKAYRHDYTLVLNYMEEYQARIDRLTEVVTAVITIQDSRRGYKDNKNLQWLTWLATFFIPLSFVATMLSMTTGPLDQLHDAAVMWAEVSVPSGLLIMSLVMLMSIAKARRAIRRFFKQNLPWFSRQRRDD